MKKLLFTLLLSAHTLVYCAAAEESAQPKKPSSVKYDAFSGALVITLRSSSREKVEIKRSARNKTYVFAYERGGFNGWKSVDVDQELQAQCRRLANTHAAHYSELLDPSSELSWKYTLSSGKITAKRTKPLSETCGMSQTAVYSPPVSGVCCDIPATVSFHARKTYCGQPFDQTHTEAADLDPELTEALREDIERLKEFLGS